jgi:hypothetical protein
MFGKNGIQRSEFDRVNHNIYFVVTLLFVITS